MTVAADKFVCFNTQPPEGGWVESLHKGAANLVSTHSRPKAAGKTTNEAQAAIEFQHTAARRRLAPYSNTPNL